jgi:hypothetical protein
MIIDSNKLMSNSLTNIKIKKTIHMLLINIKFHQYK